MTDQDRLVEDFIFLAYGCVAIQARNAYIHTQCRTEEQRGMTVKFIKVDDDAIQDRVCDICQKPITEAPDA